MKWHIIHLACPRISCANFFSIKMLLDFFTTDVFRPIPSLLDECTCKHSFLAQLNDCLQDAEPRVQDHHETQVEDWGKHTQQQTNCGALFISFLFTQFIRSVYMIPLKQQQTEWYSLPNGQGLRGMNMKPGHVNWLVHTLMDSSRQFAYPGENC